MIVYTGGTFDLFHSGHVNFLYQCWMIATNKGSCDGKVIVSLNTDEFIETYKKKPPIMSFGERKAVLRACKYVDRVIENIGGADSKPAILDCNADAIVVGTDWAKKDYYNQMAFTQEWLDNRMIQLIYVPYTEGISTTELKRRLQQ